MNNNIFWNQYTIKSVDREHLHKHKGIVLWFTGLSGSGKSTIANALEKVLHKNKISTYLLDGDNIRHGLCKDLGFTYTERMENMRRIGEVVKIMIDAALIILATFVSPYRKNRQVIRNKIPKDKFFEIFVDTPISICKKRDPKKLYKKAYSDQLKNFPGVNQIYEVPKKPEIYLNGQNIISTSVECILHLLRQRKIIYF